LSVIRRTLRRRIVAAAQHEPVNALVGITGRWLCESSPIREVELIQQRLDIDAQLAQIDQAARLPELEEAFVEVAASWAKRSGISAIALREAGVPAGVLKRAGLL
jgi:hypothetical protein